MTESSTGSENTVKNKKNDLWFDGVDKRLIETHAKKPKLIMADDRSLMTKVPLSVLDSYSRKKKQKVATNNDHSDERKQSSSSRPDCNGGPQNEMLKPCTGITDEVALDCEMVECFHHKSVLARISIVNLFGHPILDTFVAPPAKVTDYRTRWSGVRRSDLTNAPDFDTVQEQVNAIITNRIVVGHAIHNDFDVLKLRHPPEYVRDTSVYFKSYFQGASPSLKKLSESILGVSIQKGEHDSIQDAQATMKLYVHVRDRWNKRITKTNHNPATEKKMKKEKKVKNRKKPMRNKIKTRYVENL